MQNEITPRLDRRVVIKWMLTAAVTAVACEPGESGAASETSQGYGPDPDLLKRYRAGDLWPLTFTEQQRITAAALCDVIIPTDAHGPRASDLSVQDFVDEWISAPYPGHDRDQHVIVSGLAWLDGQSQRLFGQGFAMLTLRQQHALCDDICYVPRASAPLRTAAQFFQRFRDLTASGYYTTPEGMRDVGYIGNLPRARFEGPSEAVLEKLGLPSG